MRLVHCDADGFSLEAAMCIWSLRWVGPGHAPAGAH